METSIASLTRQLEDAGLSGRHVMVHASYKLLAPVENGPAGVVEAFVQAVGDGCLLFPTFDFESFTERGYWDLDRSPSRMGVITEVARKDSRFERAPHPMLSVAIYGDIRFPEYETTMYTDVGSYPYQGTVPAERWGYLEDVSSAHGAGSVFAKLIENDGLLLSIGADKQAGFRKDDTGFTASVHAAVEAEAPWRVMKLFRGVYVDGGRASIREYAASVTRDPTKHATAVTPGHLEAEKEGIVRRVKLCRTEAWVANAREFHQWAVASHRERPELWRKEL